MAAGGLKKGVLSIDFCMPHAETKGISGNRSAPNVAGGLGLTFPVRKMRHSSFLPVVTKPGAYAPMNFHLCEGRGPRSGQAFVQDPGINSQIAHMDCAAGNIGTYRL